MKERIAVLAVFTFLLSAAAAQPVWGAWKPLWPQEGVPAGTIGPTPGPGAKARPATNIKAIEIETGIAEDKAADAVKASIPTPAATAANVSQAGAAGGEKVRAGFLTGIKRQWATFSAATIGIGVIFFALP